MTHLTRLLLGLLLAIAMTLGLAGVGDTPPASAGTVYACNISSPNIYTSWGCGKAWRNSSGGISGYWQDRQTDGYCVRAYAGGGSSSLYLGCNGSTTPRYFSTSWGPTLTISVPYATGVSYTP